MTNLFANAMKIPKHITRILVTILAIAGLVACSGGSSGGVYNQTFNVSGQWTGTISDGTGVARAASMTLSDGGGTVSGTVSVIGHTCISGGNLTGTSVQALANTTGDNPLTADQENSNAGTVSLAITSGQATGGVSAVAISAGGAAYTSVPVVSFSEPPSGGIRAEGNAVLGTGDTAGEVGGIVITHPGSGYVLAPSVFFSGGGGSGAIASATIDTATVSDSVTFTLAGSSSALNGAYSGVWKSNTGTCSVETSGTITLSRL